jgi:hypothetical protein
MSSQKLRNPFRMRASERIESEASFLRLYCPLAIEGLLIKKEKSTLWGDIIFIHSSPGAGKTSLLRIFEPQSLSTLFSRRSQEYLELYNVLKKLEIFDEEGVDLLGVLLTCTRNYEVLEDLNVSEGQKKRLFFSLLNSRLILATLRGMINLYGLQFPDGLNQINFNYKNEQGYFKKVSVPCTGQELYDWALTLEKRIYSALDSFLPLESTEIEGHDELFAFEVLRPEYFSIRGKKICGKFLFMLDDAHKLSYSQRDSLIKFLLEKRGQTSIWISERKEVLNPPENLGSSKSRDYEELNIEEFWQDRPGKFEKILVSVANKRALMSIENVNSFQENLESAWNEDEIKKVLLTAIAKYEKRVSKLSSYYSKFEEWSKYTLQFMGSPFQRAIILKSCEILMYRNIGKSQLDLGFTLSREELLEKKDSSIEDSARFFLSREFNLPYYFGFSNLVKLSNNNIEQFLSFSSDLFEEMLSNNLSGLNVELKPDKQERIIKSIVEEKWKELSKIVPYSNSIIPFLEQFSFFARKETYKPNAPIIHGVTGFAVSTPPNASFFKEQNWKTHDLYLPLRNVIATCVAYNLLEPRDIVQGQKGQIHQVFYLNRWLCMKFNLPLAYGGWKSKTQDELLTWTK